MASRWLKALKKWRKYIILLLTPILLSPIPLALQDKRASCAYAIMIMAIYWTTESCSLAVTSLLPLLLFPILGVVKAKEISTPYFSDTNVLFVGGMMLAVAVEQWNLHKRIALKILLLIGTQPRRLLLGFMCPTAFLSMWVSNTATTAMMVPIAQAVLGEIREIKKIDVAKSETDGKGEVIANSEHVEMAVMDEKPSTTRSISTVKLSSAPEDQAFRDLCKATMLSIAYAANVGGTATLTGTGTNLVFVGQTEELFDESGGIGFGDWFIFAFPEAVILLLISWLWLQWMFLGFNFRTIVNSFRSRTSSSYHSNEEQSSVKRVIQREYDALGPMTFAEKGVLAHFVILALLWAIRDPKFVSGWSILFKDGYVRDATASMAVAFSLFNFPAKRPKLFDDEEDDETASTKDKPFPTLLEWKVVTKKFPWNIVLLLGAGFAMAKAAKAVNIKIHPWYLMVPATLSCSFAYMLPVATPPNAIIFSSGYLKVFDMAKTGLAMNIIAITVMLAWTHSVGAAWFDLSEFPAWAEAVDNNSTKCWV
ncbi:solute carrier family 13 member 5-like isoform X2 [Dendronephthya gigantea]|uniref:solute carrier family 13 member 5-like isoform X2 n=1 Tax=Dendronephthya gigantea TaxID=151771 RepID=UPI00106A1E8E|nr:solute carrier family 13 member 5-like isoform X2 [Dendronephthya gigantea]